MWGSAHNFEALAGPARRADVPITCEFGRDLLEYLKVVCEDIEDVETSIPELVATIIRRAQFAEGHFKVLRGCYDDVREAGVQPHRPAGYNGMRREAVALREAGRGGGPPPKAGQIKA